jgi:hypothetical protein
MVMLDICSPTILNHDRFLDETSEVIYLSYTYRSIHVLGIFSKLLPSQFQYSLAYPAASYGECARCRIQGPTGMKNQDLKEQHGEKREKTEGRILDKVVDVKNKDL